MLALLWTTMKNPLWTDIKYTPANKLGTTFNFNASDTVSKEDTMSYCYVWTNTASIVSFQYRTVKVWGTIPITGVYLWVHEISLGAQTNRGIQRVVASNSLILMSWKYEKKKSNSIWSKYQADDFHICTCETCSEEHSRGWPFSCPDIVLMWILQ